MSRGDIRILGAGDVRTLLDGQEAGLIEIVQRAYETHASGESSLPHSTFLRFPHDATNRIIALPAYLGADFGIAGIKWIASFPNNHALGLQRASAVVIVNSSRTGQPEAILEASQISAKRTAASAALAARHLHAEGDVTCVGLIGCGLINLEIARFLRTVYPGIETFYIFDTSRQQACRFKDRCLGQFDGLEVMIADHTTEVFQNTLLCSLATTATEPHLDDLAACRPGATLLHISLRDLSPRVILTCDNIVDDIDHVCRAQTSVHLAEQLVGNRNFIRCTLAGITRGLIPARPEPDAIAVYSPFGLGVLDLAVSKFVLDAALVADQGMTISSFLPDGCASM